MADADDKPKEEEVVLADPTSQPPVDEPQEEPSAKEPEEQLEPDEADPPEEVTAEETPKEEESEKPPSRREQRRVRDLLAKYPQLADQPQAPSQQRNDRLDYSEALNADPDVIKQLETDRQREGQTQYNAGLEQAKSIQFHTRLEIDAPKIEAKYPKLNPESPDFDAAAADDINSMYIYLTGYNAQTGAILNPNIRYADFVEAQMGLSDRLASQKIAETTKNIAKQASTTAIRPDGSSAKRLNLNRQPHEMTMEELYASIGQPMPKKS